MTQFQHIEVIAAPCQSFEVQGYRVRLNFNYLYNFWTYTLYKQDAIVVAGVRLMEMTNIFNKIDDVNDLTAVDTVGQPRADWYERLTKNNRNGLPDTVLIFGSANP